MNLETSLIALVEFLKTSSALVEFLPLYHSLF